MQELNQEITPKQETNTILENQQLNKITDKISLHNLLKRPEVQVDKLKPFLNITLKENIDYSKIPNLALEAREKLNKIKPTSIGQAMRISGVNPSDISSLMIYLKRGKHE